MSSISDLKRFVSFLPDGDFRELDGISDIDSNCRTVILIFSAVDLIVPQVFALAIAVQPRHLNWICLY